MAVSSKGEREERHKGPNQASRVGGDDSDIVFGQKFPGEKESMRVS
jgi:hypothetical protein